ncbi:MAG: hypothetical protein IJK21_01690 [Prevotella sp.]|nr:hypothetical protein [Prevotella sp.]
MKKYIIPVTEVHKIVLGEMVMASLPKYDDDGDGVDGGAALGKDYDDEDGYWD